MRRRKQVMVFFILSKFVAGLPVCFPPKFLSRVATQGSTVTDFFFEHLHLPSSKWLCHGWRLIFLKNRLRLWSLCSVHTVTRVECFQMTLAAALVEALSTITGYVGDPVVLPSGAAQSETLTEIEWSILNNNTVIASYYGGKKKVEWFYQFTGRLSLNSSSGEETNKN